MITRLLLLIGLVSLPAFGAACTMQTINGSDMISSGPAKINANFTCLNNNAPKIFSGSTVPATVTGSVFGSLYLRTGTNTTYQCFAASPPCTAVAAGNWVLIAGTGGGGIPVTTSALRGNGGGAAVAVSGTGSNCVHVDGTSASCPSGGTGDVVGPSSATDNAITRYDGITGKLIQNSLATLDDSGNMSTPGTGAFGVGSGQAGAFESVQGTAPSLGTTSVILYAPTSVTSYALVFPGAADTGILHATNAANIDTLSISAVSLTADVTGTLPEANGGTGITSLGTGVATALGTAVSGSGAICLATGSACAGGGSGITIGTTTITSGTTTRILYDNAGVVGEYTISGTGTTIPTTTGPAFTGAITAGTDNTTAGTLQLANGSANAHTIWASAATTTNTIAGFATVPTTGHIVTCTVSGTTCTLTDGGAPSGTGTVTSIATTSPITGGTITTTGTIACATCVVASSPGVGIAHFAGSTQTVTSSLIVAADITSATITGTQIAASIALAGSPTTTTQSPGDNSTKIATTAYVNAATGASGGLVLVEQHTASSSAALNFTTCISSTYDEYVVELVNLVVGGSGGITLQFSTDGGSTYQSSSYSWEAFALAFNANGNNGSASTSSIQVCTATTTANDQCVGTFKIYNPGGSTWKQVTTQFREALNGSSQRLSFFGGGAWESNTAVNAFRIQPASSTITSGAARCYGIAK